LNAYLSTVSDIVVSIASGLIYYYIGLKITFLILFSISVAGGVIYMAVPTTNIYLIGTMVLIAKFGVGGTFNIVFLASSQLYPAVLASTVFGICNVFARLATMGAPIVAELEKPYPILTFTILAGFTTILCLFIITPKKPIKWLSIND